MDSYDDGGFSQSRGDDDLFDEDFTPLEPSEQQAYSEPSELDHSAQQLQNLSLSGPTRPSVGSQHRGNLQARGVPRGNVRARGRVGRDRGGGVSSASTVKSSLQQSKYAPQPPSIGQPAASAPQPQESPEPIDTQSPSKASSPSPSPPVVPSISPQLDSSSISAPLVASSPITLVPPTSTPTANDSTPTTATTLTSSSRPPAVRGPRHLTGGPPPRPKLTESELSAKMAEARTRSQALSSAHARAEADAASFAERERIAQQKREKEKVNRRVLEGERERNRERKMKGATGREWDAEKDLTEASRGRDGFRRGAHGGVRYDGGIRDLENGESVVIDEITGGTERGRGRGRGQRGRGRGRGIGRGRDGNKLVPHHNGKPTNSPQPDTSAETEFPSLPPGEKPTVEVKKSIPANAAGPIHSTKVADKAIETPISPAGEGSWADQVDRVEAAKGP